MISRTVSLLYDQVKLVIFIYPDVSSL